MTIKYYGAFILSKKPIDLTSVENDMEGVQHLISEDFDLEHDRRYGWRVEVDVQGYTNWKGCQLLGAEGSTVSIVIVNLIKSLVSSMAYIPFYKRR